MNIRILIALLTVSSLVLVANAQMKLSLDMPPANLSLFGEGGVSTSMNERDFALSPDGSELYYTISTPKSTFQTIVFSKRLPSGMWSTPEVAPFAGEYSDIEPVFSADGKTLFFSSNRPLTGSDPKDFDIWKVVRSGTSWGAPQNLGSVVNTTVDEFYPSVARNGNLYWTAMYKGGPGREDIWMSQWRNNEYQAPQPLDTAVNSRFYEFNAFVDPDEQFILFTSYGRPDDAGGGDLYMSSKDASGKWLPARNLRELNSKQLDYCPFVSSDGRTLFFSSERHQLPVQFRTSKATVKAIRQTIDNPLNGTGNIYWMKFDRASPGF